MMFAALLPIVAFGLLALVPMFDSDTSDTDDTASDDDVVDVGDGTTGDDPTGDGTTGDDPTGDGTTGDDPTGDDPTGDGTTGDDPTGDPTTEDPTTEDPTTDPETPTDDTVDPEPASGTTVVISAADGTERTIDISDDTVFDPTSPPVVEGSEEAETVVASPTPSTEIALNTLGGDDVVSFGYSTSVDPGAGADVLTLEITPEALGNEELNFGTITFNDPTDALTINIPDETTGFLHEIEVQSTTSPEEGTSEQTTTLYYVLSPSQSLTQAPDADGEPASETPAFVEDVQIIAQIDLGTVTTVTTTDDAGVTTDTVTSDANTDPLIALNRDVTSTATITS